MSVRTSVASGPSTALVAWAAIPDAIARRLAAGGAALEVGCGSGFGCLALAESFERAQVLGHDADAGAIRRARALALAAGLAGRVRFEQSDSLRLGRGGFDLIVASHAVERRDAARLLNAIRNGLSPEGTCLLVEPARRRFAPGPRADLAALATAAGFSRLHSLWQRAGELELLELRR
jgi:SAM-dependent methyltransferase